MAARGRIVLAIALLAVAVLLATILWLEPRDWTKLLLFGGIVGVAAWGWGREAPAAAQHPVEATVADDAHAPEETAG